MQQHLRTPGQSIGAILLASVLISGMLLMAPVFARADTSVSVIDNSFSPQTITIAPGDTVTWTNNGSMNHTVTADDGSFSSGTLLPKSSFTHTFSTAGNFPYYCQLHGAARGVGMAGTVVVSSSASSTNASSTSTISPSSTNISSSTTASSTNATSATSTANTTGTMMSATSSNPQTATTTNTGTGTSTATTTPSAGTSSSTASTTTPSDISSLNTRVAQLEAAVKSLQARILEILRNGGGTAGNPTTSTEGTAVYADEYAVLPSGAIHFRGEGFGANEAVRISADGVLIGAVQTDSRGDFAISGTASNQVGDTTLWFTGADSGKSDSVMITVVSGGEEE